MLVLSRTVGQRILTDNGITIEVLEIKPGQVRLGIYAPPEVDIWREELRQHGESETRGRGRDPR